MSNDQLEQIQATLNQLVAGQARTEARLERMDARFDQNDARFDRNDARFDAIDARFEAVDARLDELGNRMLVLHEDLVDRIKAIPNPTETLRREMRAADAELREELTRRLDPLELTVRDHSAELARLKKRRTR